MDLAGQTLALLKKDIRLEWRSKYAFYGVLLYVISTIYVIYLSFNQQKPPALVWNVVFWIVILFAAVNAIARSFSQDGKNRQLYYYTLAGPQAIILSKIIYNGLLMIILALIAWGAFVLFFGSPVQDDALYAVAVLLGGFSFSTVFTLLSAIAAKAGNSGTLMAVMSFPLIIPVILLLIRLSKNALDGLDRSVSTDEVFVLAAISCMVTTVSLLLFTYLWRD